MKFKQFEHVRIKQYPENDINTYGMIQSIIKHGKNVRYWVTNMNIPYCGTISEFFTETELQKIKRN